ncbi:MAG: GNAT family N-acetyltransferase [Comamonadaceae bacterium]|nr:GNAT family N-acetyltransferase [Comamonadaceae bacterium]
MPIWGALEPELPDERDASPHRAGATSRSAAGSSTRRSQRWRTGTASRSDFPSVEAATTEHARRWSRNPGFHGIAAEIDGRVVGGSFLDERSTIHAIGPVSVDPAAQDRHVGRALMVRDARAGRGRRAPRACASSRSPTTTGSLSLYAKLGFDVRGTYRGDARRAAPRLAARATPVRHRRPRPTRRPATPSACASTGTRGAGEVRGQVAEGKALVVERLGRITAYSTGVHYFGHSVAETTDDLRALIGAADDYRDAGHHRPPRERRPLPLVPRPTGCGSSS